MSGLRTLIVCHGHPRFTAGGTEVSAHDLFRALNGDYGEDAHFLGCITSLHRAPRHESGVQSIDAAPREYLLHVGRFDPFMLCHAGASTTMETFGRLLSALKPDIVHYHHLLQIGAESLALVRRTVPDARIVFTLHDFHPICARDGLMLKTSGDLPCLESSPDSCRECFPDRTADRFALRKLHLMNMLDMVDRFVAPSRFAVERFAAWGIDAGRITHIPNGVPAVSGPATTRTETPQKNRFGVFGTLAPHKGTLLAMEAVNSLDRKDEASLTLFGSRRHQDAAFNESFDRGVRRSAGRIFEHGPYERHELSRLMSSVDWVVVPSLWWENAPLVILEAFRHHRPVIAADIGGMSELVVDGANGLLFRRGDFRDLARAMARAATDPELWSRLSQRVPPVQTVSDNAAAHARLYRDLRAAEERIPA